MPDGVEIVYALKDLFAIQRPTNVTIYNIALTAGEWTEVISGLSDVAAWLLYNRNKKQTLYAFENDPSTYRTLEANDILAEDTALIQLYAKSSTSDVLELEVWQYEENNG